MFSLFKKDPIKALDKEYNALLTQAMNAQRNGDIEGYGELTAQAQAVYQKLEEAKANAGK